jgi:hypothetical protein
LQVVNPGIVLHAQAQVQQETLLKAVQAKELQAPPGAQIRGIEPAKNMGTLNKQSVSPDLLAPFIKKSPKRKVEFSRHGKRVVKKYFVFEIMVENLGQVMNPQIKV